MIQTSKTRRSQRRNQQTQQGGKMTTATQPQTAPATAPVEEHRWSKAQMRHFNDLQADLEKAREEVERAEKAVQRYVRTLSEEHDLDPDKPWVIGPHGFVLAKEQPAPDANPPQNVEGAAGDQATPTGETAPQA